MQPSGELAVLTQSLSRICGRGDICFFSRVAGED